MLSMFKNFFKGRYFGKTPIDSPISEKLWVSQLWFFVQPKRHSRPTRPILLPHRQWKRREARHPYHSNLVPTKAPVAVSNRICFQFKRDFSNACLFLSISTLDCPSTSLHFVAFSHLQQFWQFNWFHHLVFFKSPSMMAVSSSILLAKLEQINWCYTIKTPLQFNPLC